MMGIYLRLVSVYTHVKDGRSLLCVTGIPERVEAASPWSDPASERQPDDSAAARQADNHDRGAEKRLELLRRHVRANEVRECDQLQQAENT